MAHIGFIGLGVMGYPMARHLAAKGHTLTVYNRTMSKVEKWLKEAGHEDCSGAATPAAAADDADFVMMCVGADPDLEEVVLGDSGVFTCMKPGAILVDHTTASAAMARRIYDEAKKRKIGFLDAPVSGGQAGAETGALTIMLGGEEIHYRKAKPLLEAYGRNITWIGGPGTGQLAKMVNQICIAGLVQGLSEALSFGQKAGLNMEKVLAAISQGAAGSWQMSNRAETMLKGQFDFGFAVDWMRKDLGMCLTEATRIGHHLPVTALVDQFYADIQAMGGSRWDTSSLIKRFEGKGKKRK